MNNTRWVLLAGMVLVAALCRVIPHPPNFTPLAALALFGGATFSDKRAALAIPLAALLLSDLAIGYHPDPIVYLSFALIVCLGFLLQNRRSVARVAAGTLAGAITFFVLTNFGVWLTTPMYAKTLAGLATCYVAAIPFFGNTLSSDILYSALLFGCLALVERRWPALSEPLPAT
jgi:hypothetical protein